MKTIFDKETQQELHDRIGKLEPGSERQWGKMTPSQAMEHTARVLDMATSDDQPVKQVFIGKAISWIFKNKFLGPEPFRPNAPTGPDYKITDDPDFESTREKLKGLIDKFHERGEAGLDGNVHPFFGRLTGKQWGETQYKHVDHHLRQFGV
ncbi:MAG: DUF1569 domain-containing protein [Acidobacteria bacterium]|nr:DUF1569 domain-containing protein [Acidobacteriota bacterium]